MSKDELLEVLKATEGEVTISVTGDRYYRVGSVEKRNGITILVADKDVPGVAM